MRHRESQEGFTRSDHGLASFFDLKDNGASSVQKSFTLRTFLDTQS